MVKNLPPLRLPCQRALESTFGTLMPKRSVKSAQLAKSYSGKCPDQRDLVYSKDRTKRAGSGNNKVPVPQLDLNIPDEIVSIDQHIGSKTYRVGYDGNKIFIPKLDLSFLNESQMIEKQSENSLCQEGIRVLDNVSLGRETYRVFKQGDTSLPFLDVSFSTDKPENLKLCRGSDTYRVDERTNICQRDVAQSKTFRIDKVNSPTDIMLVNSVTSLTGRVETYRVPEEEICIPPLDLGFLDDSMSSHNETKDTSHFLNEYQITRENRITRTKSSNANSLVTPDLPIISHENKEIRVPHPNELGDTHKIVKKVQHGTSTAGLRFNGILIPPLDLSFLDYNSEDCNSAKFSGRSIKEHARTIQIWNIFWKNLMVFYISIKINKTYFSILLFLDKDKTKSQFTGFPSVGKHLFVMTSLVLQKKHLLEDIINSLRILRQ